MGYVVVVVGPSVGKLMSSWRGSRPGFVHQLESMGQPRAATAASAAARMSSFPTNEKPNVLGVRVRLRDTREAYRHSPAVRRPHYGVGQGTSRERFGRSYVSSISSRPSSHGRSNATTVSDPRRRAATARKGAPHRACVTTVSIASAKHKTTQVPRDVTLYRETSVPVEMHFDA